MANERQVKAVAYAAKMAQSADSRMAYNAWIHVACVAQSLGLTRGQYGRLLDRLGYTAGKPYKGATT